MIDIFIAGMVFMFLIFGLAALHDKDAGWVAGFCFWNALLIPLLWGHFHTEGQELIRAEAFKSGVAHYELIMTGTEAGSKFVWNTPLKENK